MTAPTVSPSIVAESVPAASRAEANSRTVGISTSVSTPGGLPRVATFATVRATTDATHLLLVRHAQSTWNEQGRWQGTEDSPLSGLGVAQARAAAERVGAFDAVISSPLQRAHTTASILAEANGVGPVESDVRLRERHAGAFQGLTKAEIDERFPGMRERGDHPDGWEDDAAVIDRATAALAEIAGRVGLGATVLVVTHGGVIRCLEELLGARRDAKLANLGGRWFRLAPGVLEAGETVELLEGAEATVPDQL